MLTDNTTIIATANDKIRLCIKEALMILQHSPSINIQYDNFTTILKLQPNRRMNNNTIINDSNIINDQNDNNENIKTLTAHTLQRFQGFVSHIWVA